MKGETHIPVAIATAVVVLQPKTIPSCICAIAGGAAGGLICDLDNAGKRKSLDHRDDPYAWQFVVFAIVVIGILLGIDYLSGDGVICYMRTHWGFTSIIGAVAFGGICILGSRTTHRTFLHSLLACALLSASLWYFCKPLAPAFGLGFLSHICIDELNLIPVAFFWPLKKKKPWPWNRFPADGKLNDTLGAIATVLSIIACSNYCVNSFASSNLYQKILCLAEEKTIVFGTIALPNFVLYLLGVNIISFILYMLDYCLYKNGFLYYGWSERTADEMSGFIMTLLLLLDIAGGLIGKLVVVFITQKGEIRKGQNAPNYNLYIIPISLMVAWAAVLFTFGKWSILTSGIESLNLPIQTVSARKIILVYLILINMISFIVHVRTQQYAYTITPREKRNLMIALVGGAAGGYIGECISGNNKGSDIHASLPFIVIAYSIVLSCILYLGIL